MCVFVCFCWRETPVDLGSQHHGPFRDFKVGCRSFIPRYFIVTPLKIHTIYSHGFWVMCCAMWSQRAPESGSRRHLRRRRRRACLNKGKKEAPLKSNKSNASAGRTHKKEHRSMPKYAPTSHKKESAQIDQQRRTPTQKELQEAG